MGGLLAILLWALSFVVMYTIIKAAVKNGVTEAHQELIESVRAIERKLETK
ncbi:DUF6019 family protein [Desulfosporosinus sp. SB140]|uniref:DUF6019 family protein n=1 Tax=Desulfosporosinus paludis TaxID=3115649 RepID=UPI00388E841A